MSGETVTLVSTLYIVYAPPTKELTKYQPVHMTIAMNLLHKQGESYILLKGGKVKSLGVHDADDDLSIHRNVCIINFRNWSIEIRKTNFLKSPRLRV